MQSETQIGTFIDQVGWQDLGRLAGEGQTSLILDEQAVVGLESGMVHLPAALDNRVLTPVHSANQGTIQSRAERLSLCGDNIWVQVPVMTNGEFNQEVIQRLLSEGVPLAVDGVASKQQAYQLLEIAAADTTPLLINLSPATSRYDTIVTVALAHLLPQVQVISKVVTAADYGCARQFHLDGVIFSVDFLDQLRGLAGSEVDQQYNFAFE